MFSLAATPIFLIYPSQYVGGTDNTVPFDRAPGAVVQARELIEKRIREALGVEHKFNEVLRCYSSTLTC